MKCKAMGLTLALGLFLTLSACGGKQEPPTGCRYRGNEGDARHQRREWAGVYLRLHLPDALYGERKRRTRQMPRMWDGLCEKR